MTQDLYVFWEYDNFPYYLGGEIIEILKNGYVTVKGFEGYKFKPIKIVPKSEGEKLAERLNDIKYKYEVECEEIHGEYHMQVENLINEK